jgi:MFS transporter, DHA2 family, glioxin efflux transporter
VQVALAPAYSRWQRAPKYSERPILYAAKVLATRGSQIQHIFGGIVENRGEDLAAVFNAYMVGIKDVFAFSMAHAAFTVLLALVIPLKKAPSHG